MSKRKFWLIGGSLAIVGLLTAVFVAYTYPHLLGLSGDSIFKDQVKSNSQPKPGALDLTFVDREGHKIDLREFRGKKNLVVVVMRGFPGYLCPYCTAQTARLIENYDKFEQRQAEILVVFPGEKTKIPDFVQAAQSTAQNKPLPFPILLDEDRKVIEQLGIKGSLAKPSTYILDKKGEIRFAYVGATPTDRPSVKAMLAELDEINKSK
jgi:peroxiredoxin